MVLSWLLSSRTRQEETIDGTSVTVSGRGTGATASFTFDLVASELEQLDSQLGGLASLDDCQPLVLLQGDFASSLGTIIGCVCRVVKGWNSRGQILLNCYQILDGAITPVTDLLLNSTTKSPPIPIRGGTVSGISTLVFKAGPGQEPDLIGALRTALERREILRDPLDGSPVGNCGSVWVRLSSTCSSAEFISLPSSEVLSRARTNVACNHFNVLGSSNTNAPFAGPGTTSASTSASAFILTNLTSAHRAVAALARVSAALVATDSNSASARSHVPFRDSLLTRLMRHALLSSCGLSGPSKIQGASKTKYELVVLTHLGPAQDQDQDQDQRQRQNQGQGRGQRQGQGHSSLPALRLAALLASIPCSRQHPRGPLLLDSSAGSEQTTQLPPLLKGTEPPILVPTSSTELIPSQTSPLPPLGQACNCSSHQGRHRPSPKGTGGAGDALQESRGSVAHCIGAVALPSLVNGESRNENKEEEEEEEGDDENDEDNRWLQHADLDSSRASWDGKSLSSILPLSKLATMAFDKLFDAQPEQEMATNLVDTVDLVSSSTLKSHFQHQTPLISQASPLQVPPFFPSLGNLIPARPDPYDPRFIRPEVVGPFHMAAALGDVDALSSQASQQLSNQPQSAQHSLSSRTKRGDSVLHFAAANGHVACMDWLHGRGAVLSAVNLEGQSAVHVAAARGRFGALRRLAGWGCDVNQVDFEGRSPLECLLNSRWLEQSENDQEIELCKQMLC